MIGVSQRCIEGKEEKANTWGVGENVGAGGGGGSHEGFLEEVKQELNYKVCINPQ